MVQEDLKKWTFNSLRHCVSAGEPLNEEVMIIWYQGFPMKCIYPIQIILDCFEFPYNKYFF